MHMKIGTHEAHKATRRGAYSQNVNRGKGNTERGVIPKILLTRLKYYGRGGGSRGEDRRHACGKLLSCKLALASATV
eukprot:scaffold21547_cov111-Isochrysis_galbana.AAC.2